MKSCKDCVHYEACHRKDREIPANTCRTFKDKAHVVDMPCEIGRTVFIIGSKYRHGRIEYWINTGKFKLSDIPKLEKTVFLTRESAEQALKEREQG